ncbi:methyl-accepting chemotaxis protein [Aurantiacibacter sediminis]|uniref:HAMP domain-containing protein n=1 Tax=Aurantiacibacter sediminis TaxID=2793064 RepID=A0ABS0N6G1_9SPHN|nr:HAMP domain-containing methyl-accepting chemotaxis protein [Aurantiacibacter sediminis]MBH5323399.1 HAMP domain-containing protein [Aurantiacibacter sediminis]
MSEVQQVAGGKPNGFSAWLQRGSLVRQVGNVFNLFAVLAVLLSAFTLISIYRLDQRADTLSAITRVAFVSGELSREITQAKDDMGAYRARGYEGELISEAIEHGETAIDLHSELHDAAEAVDPEIAARVEALRSGVANIPVIMTEVANTPQETVAQETYLGPRYDAMDQVLAELNQINDDAAIRAEEFSAEGHTVIETLMYALGFAAIFAIALVIFGKRLVARQIVNPIVDMSDTSQQIASGDTEVTIPGQNRTDEIGSLAKALGVLRAVQQEAELTAARELEEQRSDEEQREQDREERIAFVQSLADKFEKTIADVASEVAAASAQLHNAADELAKNVENSSDRVVTADTNLQEVSSGMTGAAAATDEFVLSITEVSKQAATSSDRAQRAASAATDADSTIGDMTDSAGKISQIVEVIAGIAQRTNLLALNASIEAARGSDAGRGFAVVAAEVKELAAQTSRATAEAEALIQLVQDSTGKSASALTTIANEVMQLQSASTMIASAVDQQAVAGQDLARSIDMAARNTEIVSSSFREVSELAVSTGGTASQLRDSSGHLIKQSERLRQQVAEFLQHVRAA